jgi:hypothetical protein
LAAEDQFKINLNQNLWGLVVVYSALGAAEHWCLSWLFRLSLIAAVGMTASVLATTLAYTIKYWKAKQ